jgi:hypothetical protein
VLGLFCDDAALALAVFGIVVAAAILIGIGVHPLGAGAVLLRGSLTSLRQASPRRAEAQRSRVVVARRLVGKSR